MFSGLMSVNNSPATKVDRENIKSVHAVSESLYALGAVLLIGAVGMLLAHNLNLTDSSLQTAHLLGIYGGMTVGGALYGTLARQCMLKSKDLEDDDTTRYFQTDCPGDVIVGTLKHLGSQLREVINSSNSLLFQSSSPQTTEDDCL